MVTLLLTNKSQKSFSKVKCWVSALTHSLAITKLLIASE